MAGPPQRKDCEKRSINEQRPDSLSDFRAELGKTERGPRLKKIQRVTLLVCVRWIPTQT